MARLVEAEGDRDGLGGGRELEFAKQNLPGPATGFKHHRFGVVVAPEIGIRRSLSPKNLGGQFLFGDMVPKILISSFFGDYPNNLEQSVFMFFPCLSDSKPPLISLLGALDDIDVFSANGRLAVVRLTPPKISGNSGSITGEL